MRARAGRWSCTWTGASVLACPWILGLISVVASGVFPTAAASPQAILTGCQEGTGTEMGTEMGGDSKPCLFCFVEPG